ncbi:hypothetical protein CL654_01125 [bacterium]|nr:hypothetical protein [bacterium]|tara:strand:+ start:12755 stop:13849 length:1095 start_codon:yes stop_codon:yes gene_type:complete
MDIKNAIVWIILIALGAFLILRHQNSFPIPSGETVPLGEETEMMEQIEGEVGEGSEANGTTKNEVKDTQKRSESNREVFVTDGVKHSIPLGEIESGGPPKDGIPAIDDPKFVSRKDGDDFLNDQTDVGLGLVIDGEARFYPYQILVWHEIVNDTIGGEPVLVTYCPLCGTGVVFDRRVNGEPQEFGVSGRLWQSNLLMYNRAANEDDESLWSQVLGEAVLGVETGARLNLLPADTVRWEDWKKAHPNTKVLSQDTGYTRSYGRDPYGDYYTTEGLFFPVTNQDDRLFEKDFVLGIEIDEQTKAYLERALPVGTITDTFAGNTLTITKNQSGVVTIIDQDGTLIPHLDGFWFSWVSVHPNTEVYK